MSESWGYTGAVETLQSLGRGEISSVELLQEYLVQVDRHAWVNALVTFDTDRALRRAHEADLERERARRDGRRLPPMHGLPISVKHDVEVEGVPSTYGSVPLSDHIPTQDAPAVARLRAGGAIIFARSNLPEFAADGQAYNEVHGTTVNPWDSYRTAGGSSGGSAAAVAAGMSPLDLGSDMGGSIRIPASWCGVYGLKPTWALVSTRGSVPTENRAEGSDSWETDMVVRGPLARTAEDLELALDVLVDTHSTVGGRCPVLPPAEFGSIRDLRVLAWLDDDTVPTDPPTLEVLEQACEALRGAGATVDHGVVPPGSIGELEELFETLYIADLAGSVDDAGYASMLADTTELAAGSSMSALHQRGLKLSHRDWILLQHQRARHARRWAQTFRRYDVVVTPTVLTTALPHDHSEPVEARRFELGGHHYPWRPTLTRWCGATGVLRLPSVSTPVGVSRDGLPVGMQVVAAEYADRKAIAAAGLIGRCVGSLPVPTSLA